MTVYKTETVWGVNTPNELIHSCFILIVLFSSEWQYNEIVWGVNAPNVFIHFYVLFLLRIGFLFRMTIKDGDGMGHNCPKGVDTRIFYNYYVLLIFRMAIKDGDGVGRKCPTPLPLLECRGADALPVPGPTGTLNLL